MTCRHVSSVSLRNSGFVCGVAKLMVPAQFTQPSKAPSFSTVAAIQALSAEESVALTWVKRRAIFAFMAVI